MSKRLYLIFNFIAEIILEPKLFSTMQIEAAASTHNLNTSYPIYVTSVERIATFANGCYKQRIIEPDLRNSQRFFETEQLICPAAVNATTFTMLTQQLHLNSSSANHSAHFLPANNTSTPVAILPPTDFVPAINFMHITPNVTHVRHVAAPADLMPLPAVSQASNPINPILNHQQSSYIPTMATSNVTSNTAILSRKTGFFGHEKKKSSAKTINDFNWFFVFTVITVFFNS